MLAYNFTTGALITSFAPMFDAQVKDIAASPDGKRLYAVGPFTKVGSVARSRFAAFDLPSGNLSSLAPVFNSVSTVRGRHQLGGVRGWLFRSGE